MKYVFDENPITVSPELANEIGLEESIVVQQIRYWENINAKSGRNYFDGFYWVYNSYEDWQETNFFFMSERKIADSIRKLEKEGFIVSEQFNKKYGDNTKYYRTNQQKLSEIEKVIEQKFEARIKEIRERKEKARAKKEEKKNIERPHDSKTESSSFKNGMTHDSKTERSLTKTLNSENSSDISDLNIKSLESSDSSKKDKEDLTKKLKDKIGREMVLHFGLHVNDLTNFFEYLKKYDLKFLDWFIQQLKDPAQHNLLLINDRKKFFLAELKKDKYNEKWAYLLDEERKKYEAEKKKERTKEAKESYNKSLIELDKKPEMQELKKFLAENNLERVFVPEINYEADAYVWFSQFVVEKGIEETKRMIEDLYLKKDNCA